MTKYDSYVNIFKKVFHIEDENKIVKLIYQENDEWDSVGHMELISELEDTFDIEMETEDIIDFSSFLKGIEILNNKYGVGIEK